MLRQLRLRHSCSLDSAFAEQVVQYCPGLEHLLVDQCDIQMGLKVVGIQPFGRLRFLQVRNINGIRHALGMKLLY